MNIIADRETCRQRDGQDPLAASRAAFRLPDGVIYLDGNSLGPLPADLPARLGRVVEQDWGNGLIRSWNEAGWIDAPARVGDKIAPLIGAGPGEVIAADSTSVNLFKLLAGALRLRPGRRVILTEPDNFPTDLYIMQGLVELLAHDDLDRGYELRQAAPDRLADALDDEVAVVALTHVDYRSGRMHDMAAVTRAAHQTGALALWDLAHSAGAVPVDLDAAGADLAVGCGYKYLNGGPGAPAFLYVRKTLQAALRQPLSGWMGHAAPFDFDADYRPAEGIRRNLSGTPAMLSLLALDAALDLWRDVDMALVRRKSVALTELFIGLVERDCPGLGLASPRDPARRGSQVSFRHDQGYAVMQALIGRGVIGDFRSPDLLRFGFAPLYIGYEEVFDAAAILAEILQSRAFEAAEFQTRAAAT